MLRTIRISALVCALALAASFGAVSVAQAASGNAFLMTFTDYKADGIINGCQYTEGQLKDAQRQVPPDIEQYAPDFPGALQAALEQRARGGCGKQQVAPATAAPTATPILPPTQGPRAEVTKQPPAPPAPDSVADHVIPQVAVTARDQGASTAPAPILALAIVGGLLGLSGLAWGIERWGAWEPAWLLTSRHAVGEAGFRVSSTWADFTDWVRLGR
jgi:hypothetical protein